MEISATEIRLLCKKISSSIQDYSVSSVYSIEEGILLRLRHATKEELLIAISSFAPWITKKNLSLEQADPFVTRVRDRIERSRLLEVKQEGSERIATFRLGERSGEQRELHAEFFAGGNLVLSEDEVIVEVRNPQRYRHRALVPDEKYVLPPSRGKTLEEVDEQYLSTQLEQARPSKMASIRWFGRIVGTSRKFVEEIFHRADISPELPVEKLGPTELAKLASASAAVAREIESSNKGFLFLPKENSEFEEVDVCPIVPHRWELEKGRGLATVQEFPSFGEALDEAQAQALLFERRQRASKELRSKADELDSAIRKQESLILQNESNAKKLREFGSQLMLRSIEVPAELPELLEAMNIVERDPSSNNEVRFVRDPRAYFDSFKTPKALASRLFDEAKLLEQNNKDLSSVRQELLKRKDTLVEQSLATEDRATKRTSFERRPKQWFERYRWFLTSDRRLAIGGRDSTSNSVIINKYLDMDCLVFHADLHGSPFFVLKNGKDLNGALALDPKIEQELAQATVSFSRAWKDELGSADAYWVEPSQIKKSAPSGEYLPRGSFFIEGKKNFVKHLRVELAIGFMDARTLDNEGKNSDDKTRRSTTSPSPSLAVACGPEKALAEYCLSYVKIAPGKERGTAIARRIKQALVSKVPESQMVMKELGKKVAIDDIIRVLPSGSYKLISEKQKG